MFRLNLKKDGTIKLYRVPNLNITLNIKRDENQITLHTAILQ